MRGSDEHSGALFSYVDLAASWPGRSRSRAINWTPPPPPCPFARPSTSRTGSDATADWPILDALLSGAAGADLMTVHGLADYGQSAGIMLMADGRPETAARL